LLVPSTVVLLGKYSWWPSRLAQTPQSLPEDIIVEETDLEEPELEEPELVED
jgi:uncharacterized membrane protein YdfJ with MMPL/SSD domain